MSNMIEEALKKYRAWEEKKMTKNIKT